MRLNEIRRPAGKQHTHTKRLGRGTGSGQGGTAGRGHKGQKARAGGYHKDGFEGGQMPLQRRLPKRGFTNIFRVSYNPVNLDRLACFAAGTVVTEELLREKGIARGTSGVKILGRGDIACALTVKASAFSASAIDKIKAAGGTAEVIRG